MSSVDSAKSSANGLSRLLPFYFVFRCKYVSLSLLNRLGFIVCSSSYLFIFINTLLLFFILLCLSMCLFRFFTMMMTWYHAWFVKIFIINDICHDSRIWSELRVLKKLIYSEWNLNWIKEENLLLQYFRSIFLYSLAIQALHSYDRPGWAPSLILVDSLWGKKFQLLLVARAIEAKLIYLLKFSFQRHMPNPFSLSFFKISDFSDHLAFF